MERKGKLTKIERKLANVHSESTKDILCNSFPSRQELLGIPEKWAQATVSRENHGSEVGVVYLEHCGGKVQKLLGSNKTQHVIRDWGSGVISI